MWRVANGLDNAALIYRNLTWNKILIAEFGQKKSILNETQSKPTSPW